MIGRVSGTIAFFAWIIIDAGVDVNVIYMCGNNVYNEDLPNFRTVRIFVDYPMVSKVS